MTYNARDSSNWLVSVPLNDLLAMQNSLAELDEVRKENVRLEKRIEGLHRTLYEMIDVLGELRKDVTVSAQRSA